MSPQMEFLKNAIASAQHGSDGAVNLLRSICQEAAKAAPTADIIAMAQHLYHIGQEASRTELGRN